MVLEVTIGTINLKKKQNKAAIWLPFFHIPAFESQQEYFKLKTKQ